MKNKMKCTRIAGFGLALSCFAVSAFPAMAGNNNFQMDYVARYTSGQFNVEGGVMEIVAYNSGNGFAYAINGQNGMLTAIPLTDLKNDGSVQVLNGRDINVKALVEKNDTAFKYGDMTSVAVSPDNTHLAVALQAAGYNDAGRVAVFTCGGDGNLTLKGVAAAGVQPDMITFADNNTVLTADEGEPRQGYGDSIADPKGSVTVTDITSMSAAVVGFDAFDAMRDELAENHIVLKKNTAPSVDLEPEYIAVAGGKAYITLQEANAIAVLDIASRSYDGIYSCGFENYSATPVDIDKKDKTCNLKTYESLRGIRMPDGIAAYTANGRTYIMTANEGDAREWGDENLGTAYLNEDERNFGDGDTSPTGAITAENSGLKGKVVFFDAEDYDGLEKDKDYLFGGRSFTIYEATGSGLKEVFTSGSDFERRTFKFVPQYYNCSNDNNVIDDRSGKKGPEPENVAVGTVGSRIYAYIVLERTGGIMVYDVTTPTAPIFVTYMNTRNYTETVQGSEIYEDGELDAWVTGGDVAPEGLMFVRAGESTTGKALLLTACEVSGTVSVFEMSGN